MNTRTQNETIADRLKSARLHLNLKSKDFANAAGINPHNYSSVESGAQRLSSANPEEWTFCRRKQNNQ